jgi:hypothetical protein
MQRLRLLLRAPEMRDVCGGTRMAPFPIPTGERKGYPMIHWLHRDRSDVRFGDAYQEHLWSCVLVEYAYRHQAGTFSGLFSRGTYSRDRW